MTLNFIIAVTFSFFHTGRRQPHHPLIYQLSSSSVQT